MGAGEDSPRSRQWPRQRNVKMSRVWASRFFFSVVGVMAVAALISGTACTRWGKASAVPPTLTPLVAIYVDPTTGSDASGNGSPLKPYKTLTKAVDVLTASKSVSTSGVTINLSQGNYVAANGEKFPIVIPTSVSIVGASFGTGPQHGTFVNGVGEDVIFEEIAHAPARSAYTTLEIVPGVTVSMSEVYLGASQLKLSGSHASYWSLDVLGTLTASVSNFGAGTVSTASGVSGVLVAGGSLTCGSCQIVGNGFGLGALSVPLPASTGSPSSAPTPPSVTLTRSTADSTIAARVVDLVTDASVDVTVSNEAFERGQYAFEDSLTPIVYVPIHGTLDFGGGYTGSPGGNNFIGARVSEISIVRRNETLSALDDTWNPMQQGASRSGRYRRMVTFAAGASGRNVKILGDARGSTVIVGPAVVPTPTPSSSPSPSPTPT
jgi:hypothetical protein